MSNRRREKDERRRPARDDTARGEAWCALRPAGR
jgi:hypothetical protein